MASFAARRSSFAATPSSAAATPSAPARAVVPPRARPTAVAARCARAASRTRRRPRSRARAARRARGAGRFLLARLRRSAGVLAWLWRLASGARAAAPAVVRQVRAALPLFQTPRPPRPRGAPSWLCGLLCGLRACSWYRSPAQFSSPAQLCGLIRKSFQQVCDAPEPLAPAEHQMFELYFVASGLKTLACESSKKTRPANPRRLAAIPRNAAAVVSLVQSSK